MYMNKESSDVIESAKIVLFRGKKIRKILFQGEWWFSVVDVIEALTDSDRPSVYWTAMKARVKNEGDFQLSTICRQLKLLAPDGKKRETDCADTEGYVKDMRRRDPELSKGWGQIATSLSVETKIRKAVKRSGIVRV